MLKFAEDYKLRISNYNSQKLTKNCMISVTGTWAVEQKSLKK